MQTHASRGASCCGKHMRCTRNTWKTCIGYAVEIIVRQHRPWLTMRLYVYIINNLNFRERKIIICFCALFCNSNIQISIPHGLFSRREMRLFQGVHDMCINKYILSVECKGSEASEHMSDSCIVLNITTTSVHRWTHTLLLDGVKPIFI